MGSQVSKTTKTFGTDQPETLTGVSSVLNPDRLIIVQCHDDGGIVVTTNPRYYFSFTKEEKSQCLALQDAFKQYLDRKENSYK